MPRSPSITTSTPTPSTRQQPQRDSAKQKARTYADDVDELYRAEENSRFQRRQSRLRSRSRSRSSSPEVKKKKKKKAATKKVTTKKQKAAAPAAASSSAESKEHVKDEEAVDDEDIADAVTSADTAISGFSVRLVRESWMSNCGGRFELRMTPGSEKMSSSVPRQISVRYDDDCGSDATYQITVRQATAIERKQAKLSSATTSQPHGVSIDCGQSRPLVIGYSGSTIEIPIEFATHGPHVSFRVEINGKSKQTMMPLNGSVVV